MKWFDFMDIKMKGCLVFLVLLFITIGAVSATDVSDDSTVVADDVPTAYSTEEAISYETSTSSDNSPDTRTTINDNSVVTVGDNEVIDGNGSTFTNTSFKVTGDNVVLSNFCVDNNDFASSVIDATGVNNLTIANVCLTTTNTDGITFGIDFTNTTNSIIRDSTITVNAPSQAQIWKNDTGYWYSILPVSAVLMDGSQNITVTHNTISITNTTESYQGTTMPAVTVKNNAQNINITNNDISACGASYVYGVMMNDVVSNVKVLNNNVTVTGPLYVAGIDASTSTQSTVSSNKISVSSSNPTGIYYNGTESLAYGVILATYTAGNSQNTVNGNNITLTGNVAYGIENIYGTDNNINNNQITINAKRGLGIATHTSNNNHYDNNNIVINCNQDSINNFYEMVTPTNVGIIILNSSNNQINNNYIKINETSTTNTTYAIILDENSTMNFGTNNQLIVYNLNGIIKEGISSILNDNITNMIGVSNLNKGIIKTYTNVVKSENSFILTDDNLEEYSVYVDDDDESTLHFYWDELSGDINAVINLTKQYSIWDFEFWSENRNIVLQILSPAAYNIGFGTLQNPTVTILNSDLSSTLLYSRVPLTLINSTILDYNDLGIAPLTLINTTVIADNNRVFTLSYKTDNYDDFCTNTYDTFFDETGLLKDNVVDNSTIIIRTPKGSFQNYKTNVNVNGQWVTKIIYSEPMIINKPINITTVDGATWNGDITFISGSEGSNITNMVLNATVYINTTDIGLYNNTVNKGVVIKDSADNIIVDNTFNTEAEAITIINTLQTNIKNNNITSQADYAVVIDDESLENVVSGNYIVSGLDEGDFAVSGDKTTNTISGNLPELQYVITDKTYSKFFDDECVLRSDMVPNGTVFDVSGEISGKVFIFDNVNVTLINDGTAVLDDCQIMTGNGASVVFDGLVFDNSFDAIVFESSGNIINNSVININSEDEVHAITVYENDNVIVNTVVNVTAPAGDVQYNSDWSTKAPAPTAVLVSANNTLLENVTVNFNAPTTIGSFPTVNGIHLGSVDGTIVNSTVRDSKVSVKGTNYAYGINVGNAKDTTLENVDVEVESDYYADSIQLFDADTITITGKVNSNADAEAYGVYSTAMGTGASQNIDVTGLDVTVEAPKAIGALYEGSSNIQVADATYAITGDEAVAVDAHVDWMGNIPTNVSITGTTINIDTTGEANVLNFRKAADITVTENTINTTGGKEININETTNAQITNNYILIQDMMSGSYGNYAVITTEDDTVIENNTPTSKIVDELQNKIDELQQQLDELNKAKETTLTLDPVTDAKYNTNITITGTLVNEDSLGLYNQVVTLTIGDKTVNVTTKAGVFEYNTYFKTMDEQTITATYAGNDKYQASEDTITFTIEKGDVLVTVDEISETAYGDNVTITGTFTTSDGKAISNSNVKITINGKKYYAKTDKTGKYVLSTKVTVTGINNVTVGYSGNDKYNAYEDTTSFNAVANDVEVTYEAISDVTLGENVTITGTFKDANGKAITNSNVKITINGKKYYAKTDSTGKYTLSVATTKEGVNNVTIGYSGSAKYNAFETSTTFTVLKAQ